MVIIGVGERSSRQQRPREHCDIARRYGWRFATIGRRQIHPVIDRELQRAGMTILQPHLFATSTTIGSSNPLSVVKRRIPLVDPGAAALFEAARADAQRATIDEANWLAAARHRSVVPLHRVAPDESALETAYVGRHSLSTAVLGPNSAARALRGLVVSLTELHQSGLVHGRLSLDHLVIGRDQPDHVILCSPSGRICSAEDDLRAVVAVADRLRARVAPRSGRWSSVIAELATGERRPGADDLMEAFTELGRSRSMLGLGFRRRGPSR